MKEKTECQNCGKLAAEGKYKPLEEVKNLLMRVDAGEIVPAGECLKCGALVHVIKPGGAGLDLDRIQDALTDTMAGAIHGARDLGLSQSQAAESASRALYHVQTECDMTARGECSKCERPLGRKRRKSGP